MQTALTLIRRRDLRRLIWVTSVCQCPFYGTPGINGLTISTLGINFSTRRFVVFFFVCFFFFFCCCCCCFFCFCFFLLLLFFSDFSQKTGFDISFHCLQWRQYWRQCSWNARSYFLGKISKMPSICLKLSTLGKIVSRRNIEIFFLLFTENRCWRFMQIVSNGDNLHEMPSSVFWKNKKTIINLPSAE